MVVAILSMLVLLSPAKDIAEPPGTYYDCIEASNHGIDLLYECDGPICYCCFDEGCWICDPTFTENRKCVWDPAYRTQLGTVPQIEPPSIGPESGGSIKPPRGLEGITGVLTEELQPSKQTSTASQAGPIVINFDDLSTGGLGTGGPILVTNQYGSHGVTFNGPVAIDFSKGTAIPGFTHSGTNAIEQCYSAEFCTAPIEIKFSQGQSRVKVWVGYDSVLQEKTPVILRAFDSSGKQIAKAEENLAEQGPIPIRIPLEVSTLNQRNRLLTSPSIVRVTVDFLDENRYTNGLAVDDVEFERVEGIMLDNQPTLVKA